MQSLKALEMLNNGQIEELKAALRDEVYAEVLKSKPNANKRYQAMKRYFRYSDKGREILQKPCVVDFEGEKRTAICNGFSLVLTTESSGEISLCDEPNRYPPVARLINRDGDERKIDFKKVLAEAKSKGYKLKQSEIYGNKYLMHYDGAFFRIGLLDITYGIIDDGREVTVYHPEKSIRPMVIENDIGICTVMPINNSTGEFEEDVVVIEV